jgi:hypothetical protein
VLYPVKGEPIVRSERRGRWEYVKDTDDGHHKYLHMDCDAICDADGHCVMCGSPGPGSTGWTYRTEMKWPHTA